MTAPQIIALSLTTGLISLLVIIIHDSRKPVHDATNDDADSDEYLAALCRRVGRNSPFHADGDTM